MTKEENVLFCKIAVHNNLVGAADAGAVLRETGGGDVRELFLRRGLMDEAACAKVMRAVAARTGKGAAAAGAAAARGTGARAKPAPRRRSAAEERPAAAHERRPAAQKLSTNQMVAGVVGLIVFVVCIFYFVYILATGGGEEAAPAAEPAAPRTASGAGGGTAPGAPAPATPAAPQISEAYRQTIAQALGEALSDVVQSMNNDTMGPRGLASLDNWKKEYGKFATGEQLQDYESRRTQIIDFIKRKFETDKAKIIAAKDQGDTAKVNELRSEIAKYADEATLAELEALLR
ncbi:MAG TPA: hypothetical protein DCM87_15685 [Planctomycetes bacterium]|nr:hypothetical protein [Planctomycetota bacterium]